jgi:methionine-S-sulfoxide reductase
MDKKSQETATLAAGCFWCTEAVFQQLKGVLSVTPGYAGGAMENPSYEKVSTGKTGHAEAIEIVFDPNVISYEEILDVFWNTHDPTTPNQQGADVGTQYRSLIFYHDQKQKERAEASRENLENSGKFTSPIVTEIIPFTNFFPAENYHQDFYANNPAHPYCQAIIDPKIQKLFKKFPDKVK